MDQTGTYINIMQESLLRKKQYLAEILDLTKRQEQLAKPKKLMRKHLVKPLTEKTS